MSAHQDAPAALPQIALAGNPNVGKSTVFNALTGLRQHTGNWPGKTVENARGLCRHRGRQAWLVDLPGAYSLAAEARDERAARDYLCFGGADCAVVVADATALERNLILTLQTLEIMGNVVLCVNLMDEAAKKGVSVDIAALSEALGIPVVGTSARSGRGLTRLIDAVWEVVDGRTKPTPQTLRYAEPIEQAVEAVGGAIPQCPLPMSRRFAALKLLEGDEELSAAIFAALGEGADRESLLASINACQQELAAQGLGQEALRDHIAAVQVQRSEELARQVVRTADNHDRLDRRLDRVLMGRRFGIPVMLLLLALVFWLTLTGANYPSALLAQGFTAAERWLRAWLIALGAAGWLVSLVCDGIFRTVGWVVSVMLPPMAIFFPLFTLLEDLGYLPRVAFNLDGWFQRCHACGKQALTMCMGFGCNAAGVIGCRIIDSPRERLIAILTNNFVPCNGRFPTIIALLALFVAGGAAASAFGSVLSALALLAIIVLGVAATWAMSWLLSHTVLRGVASGFTLELPPYRMPQVGRVLVRSLLDRTLHVLGRAVTVAAPAGAVIWALANISLSGSSLLAHCANFLEPVGTLMGLDGMILLAFLLGLPANEIVLPIVLMGYTAVGGLTEVTAIGELGGLLAAHGWTGVTAVCYILFSLFHFPCGTTLWTIHKETGSVRWTALSALLPTVLGIVVCIAVAGVARLIGWG